MKNKKLKEILESKEFKNGLERDVSKQFDADLFNENLIEEYTNNQKARIGKKISVMFLERKKLYEVYDFISSDFICDNDIFAFLADTGKHQKLFNISSLYILEAMKELNEYANDYYQRYATYTNDYSLMVKDCPRSEAFGSESASYKFI